MTPLYGWSKKGQRLSEARPVQRGRLYTVIGALGLDGMKTVMCVEGGTRSETFQAFVQHLLLMHLRPGHVVVMDNLRAHKTQVVRELIESKGASVLFLPPYSPELNPIELAWAKLKHFVKKRRPRNLESIDKAIAWALTTITDKDAKGWFNACGYPCQ